MADGAPARDGAMRPVLAFDGVSIDAVGRRGRTPIIQDVTFEIAPGEAFGLVGESGCGKSTVALAAMRYLPRGLQLAHGTIEVEGQNIARMSDGEIRTLRGRRVAMVYQDPMSSLNPVMTIGRQLIEVPVLHGETDLERARARAIEMLDEVRLPDPATMMDRYPHQLSGGQQQRAVIAMALMAEPALLVMDEPTTGLDVTIEAAILELVAELRRKRGAAILFISHNLGTVARVCDRIGVLYAGRLVEVGSVRSVYTRPAHPYTHGLFDALPMLRTRGQGQTRSRLRPIEGTLVASDRKRTGCAFEPRCAFAERGTCSNQPIRLIAAPAAMEANTRDPHHQVRCARMSIVEDVRHDQRHRADAAQGADGAHARSDLPHGSDSDVVLTVSRLSKSFHLGGGGWFGATARGRKVHALNAVSMAAERRHTLAIVGESGSGKSTLAKIISGLIPASEGKAVLSGVDIAGVPVDKRPPDVRRRVQMVFQNPDSTLNPSHTIEYALARPLQVLRGFAAAKARKEAAELMALVRMPAEMLARLPHQLSGGQRQRIAIARALAGAPELVVADEPVSALDVSVQAAIINLLQDLLRSSDMALVIISHDLAVVQHMADWVAVMYAGHIVQYGPGKDVFEGPHHPYTAALLAAAPRAEVVDEPSQPAADRAPVQPVAVTSQVTRTAGCPYAARCSVKVGAICDTTRPPEQVIDHNRIACHIPFVVPAV